MAPVGAGRDPDRGFETDLDGMGNPVAPDRAVWAYAAAELVVIVAGLAAEFDDEEDPTVVARAGVVTLRQRPVDTRAGRWVSRRAGAAPRRPRTA